MERFTNAIRKPLQSKNWYAALFIALTMPDVCASVKSVQDESSRVKYEHWFNQYLAQYYMDKISPDKEERVFLSASDCYTLRYTLLHFAMDDITEQRLRQSLRKFSCSALGSHCNQINDVLCLDVAKFCEDIIKAVEMWQSDISSDKDAMGKIQNLIVIHEEPYSPIQGVKLG